MRNTRKKQKLIILISSVLIIVIIGLVIGINAIKINIANGEYYSSNGSSNNGNLLPEYIKAGITLGGVTGTLEDLDTSDATATPEDILYGKTAYVNGNKITGTYRTLGMLQVGDYVAYTPDTAQTAYSLASVYSGHTADQTISRENLSWRILSINDDGTIDLVSATPTSQTISLGNAVGYNNGVFLLNDISSKLYSNARLGTTARSIKIEDIEKHMTANGLQYVHGGIWGTTKNYTSSFRYYPNLYNYENGSGINTNIIKNNGIGQSENYYTTPTTETFSQAGENGLTVTHTFYNVIMQSDLYDSSAFYDLIHNAGNTYWLASRLVSANDECAHFGIRNVNYNNIAGLGIYLSGHYIFTYSFCLRPIVTLNIDTRIGSGDGKSSSTAYQIIG